MEREYLIKLLQKDLQQLERELSSLEECEAVLRDLSIGKLSNRVKKYFRERHRLEVSQYDINKLIQTVNTDLFIENQNKPNIRENIIKSKKILSALKYYQIISPELFEYIKLRLQKEAISDRRIIEIMEFVKIRNANILKRNNKDALSSSDLYIILNMLNLGYEEITIPEVPNSEEIDRLLPSILEYLSDNRIIKMKEVFHLERLGIDELRYLYSKALSYLQDKLFNLIEILKVKDFYFDIPTLQEIKTEYKLLSQNYILIRNELDKLTLPKEEVLDNTSINCVNSLYYSTNNMEEPQKCYFIRDLVGLREESLDAVLKLLEDFKKGITSRIKYLASPSGYFELKDDQIRIVLKQIDHNSYSVQGVFIKKSDNEPEKYSNLCNRPCALINPEYSQRVEEIYLSYIDESKRKGTR